MATDEEKQKEKNAEEAKATLGVMLNAPEPITLRDGKSYEIRMVSLLKVYQIRKELSAIKDLNGMDEEDFKKFAKIARIVMDSNGHSALFEGMTEDEATDAVLDLIDFGSFADILMNGIGFDNFQLHMSGVLKRMEALKKLAK